MNTLDYVLDRFKVRDVPSPVKMQRSRYGCLPRLCRELNFRVAVEIGVFKGRFTKALCEGNPEMKVYGVDIWDGEGMEGFYKETRARLSSFPNSQIVREWSVDAAKWFDDGSVDFIFIDAEHDYNNVKADMEAWIPKVRSGGIVSGHDYVNGMNGRIFGVREAVDNWVRERNLTLFLLKKGSQVSNVPSWFFVQP